MPIVTTESVCVGDSPCLIQNLGIDPIYVGGPDVTEDDGLQVLRGECVAVGAAPFPVHVVSENTSHVRVLSCGTGFFPAPTP